MGLKRRLAGFAGADADGFCNIEDENLAVPDPSGVGALLQRFDDAGRKMIVAHQLDFDLGHHIGGIFGATINFGLAFLATKAFDLGDGHAGDTQCFERFACFVELKWFNDGDDKLHIVPVCL